MRTFDAWLIERHERLAHRFQRWTGRTNFWLAKMMWLFFLLAQCLFIYLIADVPVRRAVPPGILSAVLLLMMAVTFLVSRHCNRMDEHYVNGSRVASFVTEFIRERWLIRWSICMVVVWFGLQPFRFFGTISWVHGLFLLLWLSFVPFSFFLACIPLPPAKQEEPDMVPAPASV